MYALRFSVHMYKPTFGCSQTKYIRLLLQRQQRAKFATAVRYILVIPLHFSYSASQV